MGQPLLPFLYDICVQRASLVSYWYMVLTGLGLEAFVLPPCTYNHLQTKQQNWLWCEQLMQSYQIFQIYRETSERLNHKNYEINFKILGENLFLSRVKPVWSPTIFIGSLYAEEFQWLTNYLHLLGKAVGSDTCFSAVMASHGAPRVHYVIAPG